MSAPDPTTGTATAEEDLAGATVGGAAGEAGSVHRAAGAEVTSDIGQAEAYILNLKSLVDDTLDQRRFKNANDNRLLRNSEEGDETRRGQGVRSVEQALLLQSQMNGLHVTHVANLNASTISERERTIRVGDIASDNMWTVDRAALEAAAAAAVAALIAKITDPEA